jgi:nucleotide-binding universal stress UspA family protein
MTGKAIVVGYDGSADAEAALSWATAEGARRSVPVRVVFALDGARDQGAAGAMLSDALTQAVALAPAALSAAVEDGPPSKILCELSAGTDLVVVGSRGTGAVGGLMVGSVASAVVRHASCPVVVVRGPAPAGQRAPGTAGDRRPVLADPAGGDPVLRLAFAQALGRGVPLLAVWAWSPLPARRDARRPGARVEAQESAARRELAATIEPWRERYPTVPVLTRTLPGAAGHALVAASRRAQLVVVGEGRDGPPGVESPARQLLHHACCPVLVVPT